jgi:hypothetical protein
VTLDEQLLVPRSTAAADIYDVNDIQTTVYGLRGSAHTYPVEEKYTLVFGGRPTHVGLRGFPAFQVILASGANNQLQPELVEALYGARVADDR